MECNKAEITPVTTSVVSLRPWQEFVGILLSVEKDDYSVFLTFEGGQKISMPTNMAKNLKKLTGQKVAILRTDLDNHSYRWRLADDN